MARVRVAAGDWSAMAGFNDFDSAGDTTLARQVLIEDITVQAVDGVQNVNISANSATVAVTGEAPRPTDQAIVVGVQHLTPPVTHRSPSTDRLQLT